MSSNRKNTFVYFKAALCTLFLSAITDSNAQTANFLTNPATLSGSVTICKGQTITYTNNSTNTNATTLYNWTFTNTASSTSNTIGPHSILYPNAGTYTELLFSSKIVLVYNIGLQYRKS